MADEYPFTPYPFSEPVQPEPVKPIWLPEPASPPSPPLPFSAPAPQTFASPVSPVSPAFSESDDEEDIAKKTALTIVAGVLVVLLLAGFGGWYFFLRDKEENEIPPPPPQEESDANLIVAAIGGKILTPEGAALLIPAGALSQDTRLEILKVRDGEATDLFELKPLGQKFLKPVTVEIPYKKSGSIILEYWKEEGGKKRALKYTVNRKEMKLKTQVNEF
jgi:hypothetical protein